MVRKRKLLSRILAGSKNIRFDDLVALVEGFGFELKRISGSHHIFKHPRVKDLLSLQPAENGRAKPYQVRQFLSLVEEYNLRLEEESSDDEE